MKKLLLTLFFLSFVSTCFSAELLVKSSPHWMDSLTQVEVEQYIADKKITLDSYNSRSQIGDIIVVRPDGWVWGKEECLPNYIVVKIPNITVESIEQYTDALRDSTDIKNIKIIRKHRFAIPKTIIETYKSQNKSVVIIDKNISTYISNIVTKTGAISEVVQPSKNIVYRWYRKISPYLNIAKTYWIDNAYAATLLEHTVMPSGGDFTGLAAAYDHLETTHGNLVTSDQYAEIKIDGTWSSSDTYAGVSGFDTVVTDTTHYVKIYTTSTARHKGLFSTSYYNILFSGSWSEITLSVNNVWFDGLQFKQTWNPSYQELLQDNGNNTKISNCIFWSANTSGSNNYGIRASSAETHTYWNNVIYGVRGAGINTVDWPSTSTYLYIYNNTVYGCTVGINAWGDAVVTAINNISYNNGTDYGTGFSDTNADNISKDTSSPNNEWDSKTVTFVSTTAGSEDFHLDSTDTSGAVGGGTVDPGSGLFSDDIDGNTRDAAWDIGADEYVSSTTRRIMLITLFNEYENKLLA